ncbi:MAG: RpiB/LacA/LacB family sugar-phosphate isomerase [Acidimicrobiales bacterium]
MIIAIAADHAGQPLIDRTIAVVEAEGHQALLVGPSVGDPNDDYPDIARAVGAAVVDGLADRGIAICGSGAGVSVAASKMHGVRAATAHDTYSAHQMVEHDAVNVLTIGARVIGSELAAEIVTAFTRAVFSGEERHVRRLAKIADIEAQGR